MTSERKLLAPTDLSQGFDTPQQYMDAGYFAVHLHTGNETTPREAFINHIGAAALLQDIDDEKEFAIALKKWRIQI